MPNLCEVCIEDPVLQEVVRQTADAEECDYCHRKADTPIAVGVEEIGEFILKAVKKEFTDPAGELPYESAEGGYQGEVIDDPYELFEEIGFELENDDLCTDIAASITDDVYFCRKDYYGLSSSDRLTFGWDRFKEVVKHSRRYTFWSANDEDDIVGDSLSSAKMLPRLTEVISDAGLIRTLPVGSRIWRARVPEAGRKLAAASDFASPPSDKARFANRMSPAGVPMFYGAEDFETAVAETVDLEQDVGRVASAAVFETLVPLNLLDLVNIPEPPSFFSSDDDARHTLYFLRHFARDVSQPIVKDGREHVDYVPTQVFTEFVRYEMHATLRVHGIMYRSSRNRRTCYVIFAEHDECFDSGGWRPPPQLLRFVEKSIRRQRITR
jgi:hypothetical protein